MIFRWSRSGCTGGPVTELIYIGKNYGWALWWSANGGGLFIEVVFTSGLTVIDLIEAYIKFYVFYIISFFIIFQLLSKYKIPHFIIALCFTMILQYAVIFMTVNKFSALCYEVKKMFTFSSRSFCLVCLWHFYLRTLSIRGHSRYKCQQPSQL